MRRLIHSLIFAVVVLVPALARAGTQIYELMSDSVRAALHKAITDQAAPYLAFKTEAEGRAWLDAMSQRLTRRIPDRTVREELLVTVHYEAKRAGLDPQMVLGLIQVESAFRKYAVSVAGARGFMQIMPFWVKEIGTDDSNLFHLRTNLRFGCVILRHYLDIEKGNVFRALGRYNGSLGQTEYPNLVRRAWQDWAYTPTGAEVVRTQGSLGR